MPQFHLLRTGAVAALAFVTVAACGDGGSERTASPPTATTSVSSSAPSSRPTPSGTDSPAAQQADSTFDIAVAGGQATGDTGRLKVAVGDKVSIRVTSDASDEVHLHGYDEVAAVAPAQPAELLFEATIPGVFAIELENSGLALASLQVS